METELSHAPAPWRLTGKAYVVFYNLSAASIRDPGIVPEHLQPLYLGGPAAVMLVDYASSNVGPYQELLFIPGRFCLRAHSGYTVTQIYVSTPESAFNGRVNWGLPKQVARFETLPVEGKRKKMIRVYDQETLLMAVSLKHGRLAFPVWIDPIPFHLLQEMESNIYKTSLKGRGVGHLAQVSHFYGGTGQFPDLSSYPNRAFYLSRFQLSFLKAEIF
jgi:hypothetical protein